MKRFLIVVAALGALAALLAGGAFAADRSAVYTLTNSPSGNAVSVFDQTADGSLAAAGSFATGGLGTGGGLGSQGSVAVSRDGAYVVAVNAASDTVSSFAVTGAGLELLGTVPSAGVRPTSVTIHHGVAYVLNAGSLSISGFSLGRDGLAPIAGSTRSLAAGASVPSEISFDRQGKVLAVTERGSNTIETFVVGKDGLAQPAGSFPSVGGAPFGFDFDDKGRLVTSDANAGPGESAATSYDVSKDGTLSLLTGPVLTHQGAACWLVVSKDGRYALTANAGGGSVSTFAIAADGSLSLVATTSLGAGSHPLDEAISGNGRFLYVLVDGRHELAGFRIGDDGSLTQVASVPGLVPGAGGLAAS